MGQSLRLAVYSDTCVVHTDIGYGWVHANIYFIFFAVPGLSDDEQQEPEYVNKNFVIIIIDLHV